MSDYKSTLNLPEHPLMRGDLAKREPGMLARWTDDDLYGIMQLQLKAKKPSFCMMALSLCEWQRSSGHSVNKILKDIIVKSKGLSGYDSPYVLAGTATVCQIELKVERFAVSWGGEIHRRRVPRQVPRIRSDPG
ncbi:class I tRNA ligase family protein [Escherichia coli]